ncbi:MAG: homoserine/homoserine lactone efflux protein [Gammaproteobacteria bacterium]|jgi:homoserine/homoserine lactone efflux protein
MMTVENLLLFTSIAFIAAITPGPAIMLVSANSVKYGLQKTIATICGNITGLFVMSLLAVLGLSTLILYSAPVFFTLKLVGALYLIYLGIKLWRNGFNTSDQAKKSEKTVVTPGVAQLYSQGIFISLSNPKAIGFTTALFPQFIDTDLPLAPQFLILIAVFMSLSFSCLLSYGLLAINASRRSNNLTVQKLVGRFFGAAFVGSGIALVFASQK